MLKKSFLVTVILSILCLPLWATLVFSQELSASKQENTGQDNQTSTVSRELKMEEVLSELSSPTTSQALKNKPLKKNKNEIAGVIFTGEADARLGMTSKAAIWKRANFDLNERNWRRTSTAAFNNNENTYDPRVYDRFRVNLDTDNKEGFNLHANLTVDPWSFTGKSGKFILDGPSPDASAEIRLKYWGNTAYTINENVYTVSTGDVLPVPEIKVINSHTSSPINIVSANVSNTYTLNEHKINRTFMPLRELWFDYKRDNLVVNFYPFGLQDQVLTFDDPLMLSNRHTWWQESPWLYGWKPGRDNSAIFNYSKGYWDNSLSSLAKDSEGRALTSLRGLSLAFTPLEATSFQASIATPKNLWQRYEDVDNVLAAMRLKQNVNKNLNLGLSFTSRLGFNLDGDDDKIDSKNYVFGTDVGYEIMDGLKMDAEIALSRSKHDLSSAQYVNKEKGNAYYVSLMGRFPFTSIMDSQYGYESIQPAKDESSFTKFRIFASRMDNSFDPSLSSYVETRDDEWWSRHIHFRRPFEHYYSGTDALLGWNDVKAFRIGNGIDIGRSTFGLRLESLLWDKKIENLFDVRNVHEAGGKFAENVIREELTWNTNDKLTSKLLGIYHRLPDTHANTDPFYFDPRTRRYYENNQIEDGKNPSIATGSLGMEYALTEWLALNGIWEFTNDIALSYDNFPRAIFKDDTRHLYTYTENGNDYRDYSYILNNQQYFPKPPYPYYNIFKAGLKFDPLRNLAVYLDYTRNPYAKAGPLDDNMNHVGIQFNYMPVPKINVFFKYTYSRWQDIADLAKGVAKISSHNNVFAELRYRISATDAFSLQYGEGSRNPYSCGVLDMGWDPYGGSLETIDTQHIFRLYYQKKF